jgi:ACT domain-containing protein
LKWQAAVIRWTCCISDTREKNMKRVIITVVGKDAVGIIAKVCTYLAQNQVNILDISQTIVGGYFNMMMVTDPAKSTKETGEIADELDAMGKSMGLSIRVMGEDIFNAMHRI